MSDGYHIGLLIMSALQYLAPEFIREKRLCWLRTPLYAVKNGSKEQYFYTDEEFNKVRNSIKGDVSRMKGLGAMGKERAHRSMFTKEYQRLDTLELDDTAIFTLTSLMSEDIEPRKRFVFENIDFSEIRE